VCPLNCLTCSPATDGTMVCSACNPQYILNSGDCGFCPRYCATCTASTSGLTCTQCQNQTVMMSNGTCAACPTNCQTCSETDTGTIACNAGKCFTGYGRAADGTCKRCSLLAFANCGTCEDVEVSKSTANCTSCNSGYALKADKSSCVSCSSSSSLQCSTCVDHPVVCTQCLSGYETTADQTQCGIQCYNCPASTNGCNNGPTTDNDTLSVCPIGLAGVGCWAFRTKLSGVTVQSRGCYSGMSNYTCTSSMKLETCTTLADGSELCAKCCTDDKCNDYVVQGFNESGARSQLAAAYSTFLLTGSVLLSRITLF
jgi:hypothetical protein